MSRATLTHHGQAHCLVTARPGSFHLQPLHPRSQGLTSQCHLHIGFKPLSTATCCFSANAKHPSALCARTYMPTGMQALSCSLHAGPRPHPPPSPGPTWEWLRSYHVRWTGVGGDTAHSQTPTLEHLPPSPGTRQLCTMGKLGPYSWRDLSQT